MAAKPKLKKIPVPAIRLSKTQTTSEGNNQPLSKKPWVCNHHDIDEIEKELKLDLRNTLEDVLKQIFKVDGKVIITLPKTPRCKVCTQVK